MNISRTKKLTTISMLCALAYIAVVVGRIPPVIWIPVPPRKLWEF